MEQLGAILVVTGDEQGDTKGSAHDGLLAVGTLAEAQGQVADGLSCALDAKRLVVVEVMVLALDAGVLNHGAGIGLQAGHGAANVAVDFDNLLDGRGLEQGGGDALLDAEDDALGGGDADGRGAELDGLEGVFDLEEAAFGGEGVDASVCVVSRVSSKGTMAVVLRRARQEPQDRAGIGGDGIEGGEERESLPYSDLDINMLGGV